MLQSQRQHQRKTPPNLDRFEDEARFLRSWFERPLVTGAVTPSGRMLARTMASYVDPRVPGPIIELGPGTGPVTDALIRRGVAQDRLVLVERSEFLLYEVNKRLSREAAYAMPAVACRLIDIHELLSDSGIGREMHVIVGQGQLDAVLRATPEERRGFIEEAAGVLKHRKRKEKARRKLDAMEANLVRVRDLTGEIRRQLGPLGRQAETARRAPLSARASGA